MKPPQFLWNVLETTTLKKEKFQYERIQENSSEVIQNNNIGNTIILNSNDAMLFDKKVIKVNKILQKCQQGFKKNEKSQTSDKNVTKVYKI